MPVQRRFTPPSTVDPASRFFKKEPATDEAADEIDGRGGATIKSEEERRSEKRLKATGEAPPSARRRTILSIGSPPREEETDGRSSDVGFLEFLKNCGACKKLLGDGDPIFMYGYLGAYCSTDCRKHQMELDGVDPNLSRIRGGR